MSNLKLFENATLASTEVTFALENGLWLNATKTAEKFGKRIDNYFTNKDTKEYMEVLAPLNVSDLELKKVLSGNITNQGTYIHPDLVVHFARWCSIEFAVACDKFIKDSLIKSANTKTAELEHKLEEKDRLISEIKAKTKAKLEKAAKTGFNVYEDGTMCVKACILHEDMDVRESDVWSALVYNEFAMTEPKITIKRNIPDALDGVIGFKHEVHGVPTYHPHVVSKAYEKWIDAKCPDVNEDIELIKAVKAWLKDIEE